MFQDFLTDPTAFHECQRHWEDTVRRIAESVGERRLLRSWMANPSTSTMDGNPIYHSRIGDSPKGIRIIQDRYPSDRLDLGAWIDHYGESYPDAVPRVQLTITLAPTKEALSIAEALVRQWLTPESTLEDMQTTIDRIVPIG